MTCIRRLGTMIVLSGTLAGCAGEIAKPVSLDVALRGMEEDMKAAGGVSLQDILSTDSAQEDEFKRVIRHEQCFYRKPNPLVPVINKDFTLTLQGTFTGQGREGQVPRRGVQEPRGHTDQDQGADRRLFRRTLSPEARGFVIDESCRPRTTALIFLVGLLEVRLAQNTNDVDSSS